MVGRRHAVHVAGDLCAQVRDANKLLQQVLGQHIRVSVLGNVLGVDVDVVDPQMQVGCGDCADAPIGLATECGLLVRGGRGDDHFLTVHVDRLGRCGGRGGTVFRLLLDLRDLLPLQGWGRDVRPEDDVPDLALSERRHIDVVLLGIIRQNEVFQRDLHLNPLLVCERGPHVVRFCGDAGVRPQHHAGLVHIDMERTQDEDEPGERRVRRYGLEPVVIEVEKEHLGLGRLENQVSELFNLQCRLERQLQLRAGDDDVREIQQVHFERVQHTLAGANHALGLLFDWERTDQGRRLLGGLPLRQLAQTFLPGPDGGVDDFEEHLSRSRVEDEDGAVDGFGRQVALERLVDRHPVDVGVVNEPYGLVREQLSIVLRRQIWLSWLGRIKLQCFPDPLPHHVQCRVGLHDLGHGLDSQRLDAREPVAVAGVEIVRQIYTDHHARRGRVDRHVVRRVVQELGPGVPLDIVRVKVAPPELDVDPVLVGRLLVEHIILLSHEAGLGDGPLVRGEKEDVRARRVHLVRLSRMDRLLLDCLNLESIELLIKHLTKVHDQRLVDLLPEMGPEDLDERDLERRDLSVHEDTGEIQLDLETHIHVRPVDGW
mmetsp:Transcript_2955/g.8790  ORF Transcript_2955/g.8790 Transcript_2955/m.8790 type:complete len:598 (+) Transcript_2955:730-2523(+)